LAILGSPGKYPGFEFQVSIQVAAAMAKAVFETQNWKLETLSNRILPGKN
jgi:hypothetical protein